jgi:hypothetical protein
MMITSKWFYRIEAIAFFLYWNTFYFSSLEPIAWRLYRKVVRDLCLELKPPDKFRAGAVLFAVNYAKQQHLFARPTAFQ